MFLCNTSAIKDWSYFLSQILPLINKTSGLVNQGIIDKAEAATTTMVTVLEPDLSAMSASHAPLNSNHTSGMEHVFQYSYSESDLLYTDNRPPARDSLPLPKAVLYLVCAALVVVALAYAIVGHLVKDLITECVDCRFFGGCRATDRNKSDINCITKRVDDIHEMSERLRFMEMSITHNHSNHLGATAKPEELILTIEETLQVPCDMYNGT
ncbi:uncharacterized protein LOC109616027 [Esox lucius]|uniref:uncharacterized protein LOC109616027 n=1 Tax=Esox lucius TaxID=8010 RepID=UPI0009731E05|nr:uncharacterized protein LOC109616027 [Esox lucius]